jgi:hypothetical protein
LDASVMLSISCCHGFADKKEGYPWQYKSLNHT